jgi:hypothetical protein
MYNISRTIDSKLCKGTDGKKGIFNKNYIRHTIINNSAINSDLVKLCKIRDMLYFVNIYYRFE